MKKTNLPTNLIISVSPLLLPLLLLLLLPQLTLSKATPPASSRGQTTSFEQLFSLEPNNAHSFTPVCDDALLRNVAQQVMQLKVSNENIFLLLDAYNLRLDHIKSFLHDHLPDDKASPHLIDVRAQGDAGVSTESSANDTNIPALNTQSSASGANLPATGTQSSTGISNILPFNTDSSASGGTNQLPSSNQISACHNDNIPRLPRSCAEAVERIGVSAAKSGIYQIHIPESGLKPFFVYCLLDDINGGPAWTVVQRRQDGSILFNRDWCEYQTGFGNLYGEFFIGLDRLHALTHAQLNELWVQMEDFENVTRYARYDSFAIGDEKEFYALNVLGKYEGNAGDALRTGQSQKFSARDADHDMWDRNCAAEYTGAWWYKACHDSNLNGQYLRGKYGKDKYGKGINWKQWHGHEYSLKYVHMAIRPTQ